MKAFLSSGCVVLSLLWVTTAFATPFAACGDCEDDGCYSASLCMGKLPGMLCYSDPVMRCIDIDRCASYTSRTCCGCVEVASTKTSYSPPLEIPDVDPAGVESVINITESALIYDVHLLLELAHPWIGDLVVTLTHNGVTVVLIDRPGSDGSGPGCDADALCEEPIYLHDLGKFPIECPSQDCLSCFPDGTATGASYKPNEPLAAFVGQDALGPWVLRVSDHSAGQYGALCSCTVIAVKEGATPVRPVRWGTVKGLFR